MLVINVPVSGAQNHTASSPPFFLSVRALCSPTETFPHVALQLSYAEISDCQIKELCSLAWLCFSI